MVANPKLRARVVQISDLHFGSWGERPVLDTLRQIVIGVAPDLIIASGDLAEHPFPWSMARVSRFLASLCEREGKAPIPLLTIAGNHDYRIWGNLGLGRLSRIPFYLFFREKESDERFSCSEKHSGQGRWRRALSLAGSALWPWSDRLHDPLQCFFDPKLSLAVVGFNSNNLAEMMAAGKVDSRSFQELNEKIKSWSGQSEFERALKIAVVHHHPVPIPFMATDLKDRVAESFMIFYNAGTFLRTLWDHGFHLVLHGHKHFAGFSRISYDPAEDVRDLVIAAAGSAGHKSPDDPRGNHLHILEFFDDDTAKLESRFFSDEVFRKDDTRSHWVLNSPRARRWRLASLAKKSGILPTETVKKVELTSHGYSATTLVHCGCRVAVGQSKSDYTWTIEVPEPTYLRAVRPHRSPVFSSLELKTSTLRTYQARLNFGDQIDDKGQPFDFGIEYRHVNSHALTPEEFARRYGHNEEYEYSSLQCDLPSTALQIEVIFPDKVDTSRFEVDIEVKYDPDASLDNFEDANLQEHPGEKGRLRHLLQVEPNRLSFRCIDPVPGFLYRIRWRPKRSAGGQPVTVEGLEAARDLVEQGQKLLLELANGRRNGEPKAVGAYESILDVIGLFRTEYIDPLLGTTGQPIDITLMVHHEGQLTFVAASSKELSDLLLGNRLGFGEGVAGFAFEKARVVAYHPRHDEGFFIRDHETSEHVLIDQSCLFSIPWYYHPQGHQDRFVPVGVLNIGTREHASQLVDVFDLSSVDRQQKCDLLSALTAKMGNAILALLVPGHRPARGRP